jgi:hypothetical protein
MEEKKWEYTETVLQLFIDLWSGKRDASSSLLSNFALEYDIRKVQKKQCGTENE